MNPDQKVESYKTTSSHLLSHLIEANINTLKTATLTEGARTLVSEKLAIQLAAIIKFHSGKLQLRDVTHAKFLEDFIENLKEAQQDSKVVSIWED